MHKKQLLLLSLLLVTPLHATIFDSVKDFFEEDVAGALQDAGNVIKDAGQTVADKFVDISGDLADCFKNTKFARAIDYNIRIGALLAAEKIAENALDAAEKIALTTLKASQQAVQGSLKATELFLDDVARVASDKVLQVSVDGPAEVAKGFLDAAQKASVGIIEGGKFILDQTLDQFNVTCVHFDTNEQAIAQGNLGKGVMKGKLIKDFSIDVNFDIKSPGKGLTSLVDAAGIYLKNMIIDPFATALGKPLEAQATLIKNNEEMLAQTAKEIAGLKTPEGVAKAQEQLNKSLKQLEHFREQQREFLQKEIAQRKLGAEKLIAESLNKTYEELIAQVALEREKRKRLNRPVDANLRLLELELLKRTAVLKGEGYEVS